MRKSLRQRSGKTTQIPRSSHHGVEKEMKCGKTHTVKNRSTRQ
jgi:hypothetical protein